MRRILLIATLCLLAVTSIGCKKARLREVYVAFCEHTTIIPDGMFLVQGGIEYQEYTIPLLPRMIVYLDSTQCSACQISKLGPLRELQEQYPFYLAVIVQVPRNNRDYVEKVLLYENSDVPVFLDRDNVFMQINPFVPRDSRFHKFLTDERGKVIFVGNPVANEKLRVLFSELF